MHNDKTVHSIIVIFFVSSLAPYIISPNKSALSFYDNSRHEHKNVIPDS